MNGSGPKIRLNSPLAPQPVPQKLASMPSSKGPFSANIHPITPKLSVPIPEGMCFRKMVGGPLRKWTDRGQKSTSNHHKDPGRLLTNPLKVNFPEVISPRICIWSFPTLQLYAQQSWEWSDAYSWRNDLWKVNFKRVCEKTAGVLMVIWSGFLAPIRSFSKGAPHHFPKAHALRYGHRKFGSDWMYIRGEWALRRWHWS